jgi:prolipoprotein diacylglyceryl transferase
MLTFIHWTVNPEIFRTVIDIPFLGEITLAPRYYGLLFALAFVFGYLIIQKMFKKEGLPNEMLDRLATYMVIATIIGARLGHVLFYEPAYYFSHPVEILKIWHGGLASHGAAIAIILALWLFSRKYNKHFLWTIDRIAVVVALSGLFIRTGNLMNSEIYGSTTQVPWAFIFELSDPQKLPRHPSQIYEALAYFLVFIFLYLYYYRKDGKPKEGLMFSWFMILVFGFRFIVEFFKANQVPFESQLPLNMGQLLSIPFVILGVIMWYLVEKGTFAKKITTKKQTT